MARRPDPAEIEARVREWTGPVYGWALRMLGNRAEAEDATQEAFLRAFERGDRYDPSREFGPWMYRVATRVVLNRLRSERARRRAHERAAGVAPPRARGGGEDAVERAESERVVEEQVRRLPPDDRAVVVLHFYAGLPQAEVASALDLPRTTVQSRLERALEALRASLRGSHAALVPALEPLMRAAPPPPVPPHLPAALVHALSSAAASSLVSIGGVLMTQKLALVALAAALVLLGAGFATGRATVPAEPAVSAGAVSPEEHARVVAERERLREELDRRGPRALAVSDASHEPPPSASAGGAPPATEGPAAAGVDGAPAEERVDWSRFGRLLADSVDLIDAARDREEPDAETKRKLMGVLLEYQRASVAARALSDAPFFDARVLPGLVEAVFAQPLDLPAPARAALDAKVREALESARPELAAAAGRPVATYAARERLVERIVEAVRGHVPEDAGARFEKVERIGQPLLAGGRSVRRISVVGEDPERRFADGVRSHWQEALDLDDGQAETARPVADAFARAALDAWRRHGVQPDSSARTVRAAEAEVLRAQHDAERALDAFLTAEQRGRAAGRPPELFYPTSSESDSAESTFGDGI